MPAVLGLDVECGGPDGGGWMLMEWVGGRTVREVLSEVEGRRKGGKIGVEGERDGRWEEGARGLMGRIGRAVGRLHEVGVVHGDLTTSNLMLRPVSTAEGKGEVVNGNSVNGDTVNGHRATLNLEKELKGEIVLIDFGLAGQSIQDEDKAVDLYVLERAFGSTHPEAEEGFQEVLRVYGESYKGAKVVLNRLEGVRMRGRKKSMIG